MGRANPLVQSRPRLFDPHKYISLICQGRAGVSLHERHRDLVAVEPPREKVATILGVEPVFRAGVRGKGGDQPRDAPVALSHRRHLLRGFLLLLRRALSTHNVPALAKSYLPVVARLESYACLRVHVAYELHAHRFHPERAESQSPAPPLKELAVQRFFCQWITRRYPLGSLEPLRLVLARRLHDLRTVFDPATQCPICHAKLLHDVLKCCHTGRKLSLRSVIQE
mmetsp:Transcript_33775/g.54205  ORF Transcript_33775/g.54205 Transcript_33775/m.54205 type:complete len:225 (-) Transcript_33775:522-1196(-)